MNLPNKLTILRVIMIPFFVLALMVEGGEIAQKVQVGCLNGDGHRHFIDGFHLFDNRKRRHQRSSLRCVGAAIDGIYHVCCGHGLAIVELDALTDIEGIRPAVAGDLNIFNYGN